MVVIPAKGGGFVPGFGPSKPGTIPGTSIKLKPGVVLRNTGGRVVARGGGGRSSSRDTSAQDATLAKEATDKKAADDLIAKQSLEASVTRAREQRESIQSRTIGGQIGSARGAFRDTGQIQELGQPPSFSQESVRGFGGTTAGTFLRKGVAKTKGFLQSPTQIPIFIGGGGSIPISDITDILKKTPSKTAQFIGGGVEAVAGTPGDIAKFSIPFAAGGIFAIVGKGASAGATAIGLGRFVPTASKVTGAVLGGTFLTERGFAFSKTETPEEKGAFFAETGVGLASFVGGQKVVSSLFKPLPSKADIVVFKGVEQKLFDTSGITRTRLEFGTTSGRKGISEVFNIPAGKDLGKDISVSFARGTTFKNVFEIPRGVRPKAETPFSSIIVSESKTGIGKFEIPTSIAGVVSQKDIPVTIGKSRFGISRFGVEPVKEVKTATLGIKLDEFTLVRGGVGSEGKVTEFRGVTGRLTEVAKDTKLFGIERLPGARRGKIQEGTSGALIQKSILQEPAPSLEFAKAQTISALPKTFIPTQKPSVAGAGLVGVQRAVGGLGLDAFQIQRGAGQRFGITGGVTGVGVQKQDFGELDFVGDIGTKAKLDFVGKVKGKIGQDVFSTQLLTSGTRQAQIPQLLTKQTLESQTRILQEQIPAQKAKQKLQPKFKQISTFRDSFAPLVFSKFGGFTDIGGFIPPVFPALGGTSSPQKIIKKGKKVKRKIRPSFTGAVLELEIGLPKTLGGFGLSPFDIRGLAVRKKKKSKGKRKK